MLGTDHFFSVFGPQTSHSQLETFHKVNNSARYKSLKISYSVFHLAKVLWPSYRLDPQRITFPCLPPSISSFIPHFVFRLSNKNFFILHDKLLTFKWHASESRAVPFSSSGGIFAFPRLMM